MATRVRGEDGQFKPKSSSERKVRSIRATDQVWISFNEEASTRGVTTADLLEDLVLSGGLSACETVVTADVINLLEEGLTLKANAGGKIKDKIRAALALLR